MTLVKSRTLRGVFIALGFVWVGIAFAGVAIPGIPTTGPILLAAFFFSKSSERFDSWLVTNKYFGSIVRDWRAGAGFTVVAKTVAVTAIVISFGITTWFFLTNPWVRAGMWSLAMALAVFIVSRPTKSTAIDPTDQISLEHT